MKNYIQAAKDNEIIFRMILDKFNVEHKDLSIDEIYTKYSEGRRYGIWTILKFEEKEPNVFEFSNENIAALSGIGRTDLWTIEDDKLKHVKNVNTWMS
jgi:hypothetical protein